MDRQTVAASGGAADLKANDFVSFGTAETLTAAACRPHRRDQRHGERRGLRGLAHRPGGGGLQRRGLSRHGWSVKALVDAPSSTACGTRTDARWWGCSTSHAGDDIGLISVKNGVALLTTDGTVLTGDKAVAWVTGATAGAEVNESLTNTAYDGAVDVDVKYHAEDNTSEAMQAGEFVFYPDGERPGSSPTSTAAPASAEGSARTGPPTGWCGSWTAWANDVARTFSQSYLGTQTNSETGGPSSRPTWWPSERNTRASTPSAACARRRDRAPGGQAWTCPWPAPSPPTTAWKSCI
ncbi:MAG: phage tail sheath subtilisin-like domain-containing protein [Intestinimonas sp.]